MVINYWREMTIVIGAFCDLWSFGTIQIQKKSYEHIQNFTIRRWKTLIDKRDIHEGSGSMLCPWKEMVGNNFHRGDAEKFPNFVYHRKTVMWVVVKFVAFFHPACASSLDPGVFYFPVHSTCEGDQYTNKIFILFCKFGYLFQNMVIGQKSNNNRGWRRTRLYIVLKFYPNKSKAIANMHSESIIFFVLS